MSRASVGRENKAKQSQSQNRKQKLARHQCGGIENRRLAHSVQGQDFQRCDALRRTPNGGFLIFNAQRESSIQHRGPNLAGDILFKMGKYSSGFGNFVASGALPMYVYVLFD